MRNPPAPSFINPFVNVYFARLGLSASQIGLLSALRPWISAPCGSLLAGLADRWGAHRGMLVGSYLGMTWIQVGVVGSGVGLDE